MSFEQVLQQIINGLMLGSIYISVAVAFTLTIGILNFLNFTIPALYMLAGMGTGGADSIGSAMAVALVTTLYGAFAANFLFLPFADKLKGKNEVKKVESALMTEGVLLIALKKHPIEIRERLNAYLPPAMRKEEEE